MSAFCSFFTTEKTTQLMSVWQQQIATTGGVLNLSNQHVDEVQMIEIASIAVTHGTELRLYNSKINSASLTRLASRLLTSNTDTPTATINISTLTLLDLGGNALGDAGITSLADALAGNCSLRHLFLSTNQITAVGLGVLLHSLQHNHQSALVELFLFGNKIGDDGAQLLSDFMLLQFPHESEPAYHSTDAFPSSLTSVNITANQITNRGACALAAALAQNACMQTLICGSNVFGNSIGDEGAVALAEALKLNETLSCFSLLKNDSITSVGVAALTEALAVNSTMTEYSGPGAPLLPLEQRQKQREEYITKTISSVKSVSIIPSKPVMRRASTTASLPRSSLSPTVSFSIPAISPRSSFSSTRTTPLLTSVSPQLSSISGMQLDDDIGESIPINALKSAESNKTDAQTESPKTIVAEPNSNSANVPDAQPMESVSLETKTGVSHVHEAQNALSIANFALQNAKSQVVLCQQHVDQANLDIDRLSFAVIIKENISLLNEMRRAQTYVCVVVGALNAFFFAPDTPTATAVNSAQNKHISKAEFVILQAAQKRHDSNKVVLLVALPPKKVNGVMQPPQQAKLKFLTSDSRQADLLVHHVSSVYPRLLAAHKHALQALTEAQSAMSDKENVVEIAKRRVDEAIELEHQQQQQREREQQVEQKKDSIASPTQQAIAAAADSIAQLDELNSDEFAMPPWFRRQSVLDINKSRGDLLRQKTRPSLSVSLESLNQNYNADISIMSSLLSYPPTPAGKVESVFGEQIEQLTPRKRVTIHAEPIVNQVAVETIETVETICTTDDTSLGSAVVTPNTPIAAPSFDDIPNESSESGQAFSLVMSFRLISSLSDAFNVAFQRSFLESVSKCLLIPASRLSIVAVEGCLLPKPTFPYTAEPVSPTSLSLRRVMLDLRLSPTTSTPLSPAQSNSALEPSLSRASVTQLLHYIPLSKVLETELLPKIDPAFVPKYRLQTKSGDDFWRDVSSPATSTSYKTPLSFFPASMKRLATPVQSKTAIVPESDLNVSAMNLAATELASEPAAESDLKSIAVEHQPIKSEVYVPVPETTITVPNPVPEVVEPSPIEVPATDEITVVPEPDTMTQQLEDSFTAVQAARLKLETERLRELQNAPVVIVKQILSPSNSNAEIDKLLDSFNVRVAELSRTLAVLTEQQIQLQQHSQPLPQPSASQQSLPADAISVQDDQTSVVSEATHVAESVEPTESHHAAVVQPSMSMEPPKPAASPHKSTYNGVEFMYADMSSHARVDTFKLTGDEEIEAGLRRIEEAKRKLEAAKQRLAHKQSLV